MGIGHAQQKIAKLCDFLHPHTVEHGEVAVVVGAGLSEHCRGAARNRALACECQVIGVEDTGCIRLAAEQRADGVAFAADVIAVLADENIENADVKIPLRHESLFGKMVQGDECRLWRVARTHRDDLAAQSLDRLDTA